jgi:hypothetical protein
MKRRQIEPRKMGGNCGHPPFCRILAVRQVIWIATGLDDTGSPKLMEVADVLNWGATSSMIQDIHRLPPGIIGCLLS